MNAGLIYTFKVERETDIGYILKYNEEEIFLHKNDSLNKQLKPGEEVSAFLFHDFKGRLAATLEKPFITIGEMAFLEVVGINYHVGVFLNNGIGKDVLLSRDDLPLNREMWPKGNDKVLVTIREKGRIVAKRITKDSLKTPITLKEKDEVDAYVMQFHNEGLSVVTLKKEVIFIHKTQTREKHRLGEQVLVRVMKVYEEVINGTLIKQKEDMIESDALLILNYLKERKEMDFGNNSHPDEIYSEFNLSKKAFKRALGNLYRQRLIDFKDEKTIYVGDSDE